VADTIIFPTNLPPPTKSGYAESHAPMQKRTPRDQGEDRSRPCYSAPPDLFEVSWSLTDEQYDAFETFFHDSLFNGVLGFVMRVSDKQAGLAWHNCQFFGLYKANKTGPEVNTWSVSARLLSIGGAITSPVFDTVLAASMGASMGVSASLNVGVRLAGLLASTGSVVHVFPSGTPVGGSGGSGSMLTEGGDNILLESSGRVLTE